MSARLLLVALVAGTPLAASAADEENPLKKAKVGDFATYKVTNKFGGASFDGTMTRTVTAKDDKQVVIKSVSKPQIVPDEMIPVEKIDLTRPYDPTYSPFPGTGAVKVEKLKDGKEKIKAGGKEYDCTWETYKMGFKMMGVDASVDVKVWYSKDAPLVMVKTEATGEIAGTKIESTVELIESGTKSD